MLHVPLAFKTLFGLGFRALDNHVKDPGIDTRNIFFRFKKKMFLIRPFNIHIIVSYF